MGKSNDQRIAKIKNTVKLTLLCILLGFSLFVTAQSEKKLSLGEQPTFNATKNSEVILVDGKMNEEIWQRTESRNLDYFYNIDQPDDDQQTTLRMLWDEKHIYLFYGMKDKDLTARETLRDGELYLDDCAEIFFITAPDSLDTHFGYQLNLNKASNDFIYFNDFYKGEDLGFKGFNPDFQVEVIFDGTINDKDDNDVGWTMEIAIPISNFGKLDKLYQYQQETSGPF